MDRDAAATYLATRLAAYLSATGRTATDGSGNLGEIIDDALRALGVASDDLSTAEAADDAERTDWEVQLTYRALLQITRDLGATHFDVTVGDSFKLSQVRAAAEKDLALAEAAVLARFGTLGVVAGDDASPFVAIDLNYLVDCEVA